MMNHHLIMKKSTHWTKWKIFICKAVKKDTKLLATMIIGGSKDIQHEEIY